jgi:integrase
MTLRDDRLRRRANGDGSVFYDHHRGRWFAVLDLGHAPDGRRQRTKRSADTEREATKLLREMQRTHAQQQDLTAARMTVTELVTKWRSDVAPLTQSVKTQRITEGLCTHHVLPTLGRLRVADVTPEHVESAIQRWVNDGLSRSTILKCRGILTAAFRHAESRRVITWNPAKLANLPPTSATPTPQERTVLTAEQFGALIAAATGSRLQLFVTLLGTYGFRPGELAGLRWEHVDLDRSVIFITESLHWTPTGPAFGTLKTARARRPVQLDPADVKALTEHRQQQAVERDYHGNWPAEWAGLVFPTANGRPVDDHTLRRDVRALGRRIGLDNLTPYGLRGTATSIASHAGVPVEELADLLGHVDTKMVMRHYRKPQRAAYEAGLTVARLRVVGSH